MRVLFVDPPGHQRQGYNLGLALLSASLSTRSHQVAIFDCNEPGDLAQVIGRITPHVVGLSVKTATYSASVKLAAMVRQLCPRALIVAGGPHATINPQDMLRGSPHIDLVLAGEAEQALVDLCRHLADLSTGPAPKERAARVAGLALCSPGVAGLALRSFSAATPAGPAAMVQDLDALPFPLLPAFVNLDARQRPYHLMTGRGCPCRCTFCSVGLLAGRRLRSRSIDSVIEELLFARSTYGIQSFEVDDDNFTCDLERAKLLCEALVQQRVELPWYLPNGIRAESLDRELAQLLARASCHTVALGIESADPEVLRIIRKGLPPQTVRRAVSLLKEAGVRVMGFFIIGLPGSTLPGDLQTIAFERSLGLDDRIYNSFVPYPRTEAHDWAEQHGRLLADVRDALHFSDREEVIFETPGYPREQREAALALARLSSAGLAEEDLALLRDLLLCGVNHTARVLVVQVESYRPQMARMLQPFAPLTVLQVNDLTSGEVSCIEPDGHVTWRHPIRPGWRSDLSLALGLARPLAGRSFDLMIVPAIHSYLILSLLSRSPRRLQYTFDRRLSSTTAGRILQQSPGAFLDARLGRGRESEQAGQPAGPASRAGLPPERDDHLAGGSFPWLLSPVALLERGYGAATVLARARERLAHLAGALRKGPLWARDLPLTLLVGATFEADMALMRLRRMRP